mgnify:CR=1 FL=1
MITQRNPQCENATVDCVRDRGDCGPFTFHHTHTLYRGGVEVVDVGVVSDCGRIYCGGVAEWSRLAHWQLGEI